MTSDSPALGGKPSISEARFRKRRRRFGWIANLLVLVGIGIAIIPGSNLASGSTSLKAQESQFLRLLDRGVDGSYEATFLISGHLAPFPGSSWTVVVAHQNSPVPQTLFHGHWSFLIRTTSGFAMKWIETGSTHQECWSNSVYKTWRCGQGTTEAGNETFRILVPYVTMTIADQIKYDLIQGSLLRGEQQNIVICR